MNTYIKKKKIKKIIIVLIVIISFLTFAFYTGLTVENYKVISDKIIVGNNIRIVLLSDLHSCIYGEDQNKINKIKKTKT